jgi:chaperonin cofactor prefoldin
MQHELDYLDARVEETGAAVKKIKAQIKGLQRSLREAEELHEDAKKAKKAGRDLPEVQRRRAR